MLITPRPLTYKKRQFWEGRGVVFTYAAAAGRKSTSIDGMDIPLAAILNENITEGLDQSCYSLSKVPPDVSESASASA